MLDIDVDFLSAPLRTSWRMTVLGSPLTTTRRGAKTPSSGSCVTSAVSAASCRGGESNITTRPSRAGVTPSRPVRSKPRSTSPYVDAHADLGNGDNGYWKLITEVMYLPVEKRCAQEACRARSTSRTGWPLPPRVAGAAPHRRRAPPGGTSGRVIPLRHIRAEDFEAVGGYDAVVVCRSPG